MKNLREQEEAQWDRKKILITGFFLIVGLLVALELKGMFLDKNKSLLGESSKAQPVNIEKPNISFPINIQSEVGPKIDEIKKNINNLDVNEVASSSPQIQKVLNDIQSIKNLPANEAKQTCLKLCSGI